METTKMILIVGEKVISKYGLFNDGISRMRLKYHGMLENIDEDIIGILSATSDPTVLSLQIDVDTLPGNTINPIDRVIDPSKTSPGFDGLPFANLGPTLLMLEYRISIITMGESIYPQMI